MSRQRLSEQLLLAPSRLVTGFDLRSGYDMSIAATAADLDFDGPDFDLDADELERVERAFLAVKTAYDAYHWRPPMTMDEIMDEEIGYAVVRSPAERLRAQQTQLELIKEAVAEGDLCLPPLIERGLVLTVTTRKVEYGPVPASVAPKYPFAAVISVRPAA